MGGGRSDLFPGTKGSDYRQLSLLEDPIRIHHRGPTYIPDADNTGGAGRMLSYISASKAQILITPQVVLEKCMQYRLGALTEDQLVKWLRRVLNAQRYYLEYALRELIQSDIALFEGAKEIGKQYNHERFIEALLRFEGSLER